MADWVDMVDLHLDNWELMRTEGHLRNKQPKHKDTWWRIILPVKKDSGAVDFTKVRSRLHKSKEIAARYVDGQM
jgi:hypothetical protein